MTNGGGGGGCIVLWFLSISISTDNVEIIDVLVQLGAFAPGPVHFQAQVLPLGSQLPFFHHPPITGELECVNTAGISSQALVVCLEN